MKGFHLLHQTSPFPRLILARCGYVGKCTALIHISTTGACRQFRSVERAKQLPASTQVVDLIWDVIDRITLGTKPVAKLGSSRPTLINPNSCLGLSSSYCARLGALITR